jgi:RimJ/RimL family protein N-acetyltransferase
MRDQSVRLREASARDLDFVVQAEQHLENRPYILGWSIEQHRAALRDPQIVHLLIEATPDNQPVGFAVLVRRPEHGCVEFRRIVVTEKGKGYGRAAVRMIKDLAFNEWRAHRLWLDVMVHNRRARRLYESEGFMIEGTLRECVRQNGAFRSLLIMSILAHEYETGSPSDA